MLIKFTQIQNGSKEVVLIHLSSVNHNKERGMMYTFKKLVEYLFIFNKLMFCIVKCSFMYERNRLLLLLNVINRWKKYSWNKFKIIQMLFKEIICHCSILKIYLPVTGEISYPAESTEYILSIIKINFYYRMWKKYESFFQRDLLLQITLR